MKLMELMHGYLDRGLLKEGIPDLLPIKPQEKSKWKTLKNPNRFYRKIKFKNHFTFKKFINLVLEYEGSTKHNAKILIGFPDVVIEVWTHTLEDITQMDIEYIREIDNILRELI